MKRILYFIVITFIVVSCGKNELVHFDHPFESEPEKPNRENSNSKDSSCYEDYRALKGTLGRWNFLGFENFGFRGIGRCRGHAIIGQKFSELATFNASIHCNLSPIKEACKKDIDLGIKNILNFKAHTFTGFNSLYEFSSNTYVKEKLKSFIRGIDHRFSAVQANIRDFDPKNKNKSIFFEIIERIKENQQPYIGVKGDRLGHHAIIAYSVDYIDNKEVICIRDSNIIQRENGELCQSYLFMIDSDVFYHRENNSLSKLYIFSLTSDEDLRIKNYISAQFNKCLQSQIRK